MKSTLELAIKEITPYLTKVSRECYRANAPFYPEFKAEDYFQEIMLYLIKFYNKLEPEKKESLKDLVPILISTIGLEKKHYFSNKIYGAERGKKVQILRSTSSFTIGQDDVDKQSDNQFNLPESCFINRRANFLEEFEFQDFRDRAIEEVSKYEDQVNGITEFFKEATEPSDDIALKFVEYVENAEKEGRTKRGLSGPFIPPVVLTELLGHSRNRITAFKRYISYALADLGIPESSIEKDWTLAKTYFKTRKA